MTYRCIECGALVDDTGEVERLRADKAELLTLLKEMRDTVPNQPMGAFFISMDRAITKTERK